MKSVYSYLALLMSPWNIQETGRCELSWACGNSFGAQNSIAFFDPRIRDSQILDCIARLHFWKHNFCARKNLAILNADKLQSFDGAPISYCGTLPTDNSERARGRESVCPYVCVCVCVYVVVRVYKSIWNTRCVVCRSTSLPGSVITLLRFLSGAYYLHMV